MKMSEDLTQKLIETAIQNYLSSHVKDKNCRACGIDVDSACASLCPAHELDMALADYNRAKDRLTELYFTVLRA
jgi:hypothetical protein